MPPAPSQQAQQQQAQQDLHAALRTRLIESGEYSRVLEVLREGLEKEGWEDTVRDVTREKARIQDPPSLQGLIDAVQPEALSSVPPALKAEVEAMIKAFVEKSVE
ncbi:hypothetical protein JCM11641_007552 [Rhodosporidiobolus odoratus]